ncbi:hypothetical protein A167_00938 [Alcanivorax sp. S71-1-4]|uniref:CopG family transcriptional regulator n=1 Tax=Alcanivorax sp. S71-1-4 TaxID=1177159 RepID=UPI001356E210|nr:CopG family transcriptional regulator [Alcanivorax sp. S71-1-4]KAF0810257.1 hypothetical protein A167_00938 [Alcanivorax sp. S71-1-4]
MDRLTINLPEGYHQALKEAAARRGIPIGKMVAEALAAYVKPAQTVQDLLQRARLQSALTEAQAHALAEAETRAARRGQ